MCFTALWDFNVKVLHKVCIDKYSSVIHKPVDECCPQRCHMAAQDLELAENSLLSLASAAPLVHFARMRCAPIAPSLSFLALVPEVCLPGSL